MTVLDIFEGSEGVVRFKSREERDAQTMAVVWRWFEEECGVASMVLDPERGITPELLQQWFQKQVGWWGTHASKLRQAMEANIRKGNGGLVTQFVLQERLDHAVATIRLLRQEQHILCCYRHGVEGVDITELFSNLPPSIVYRAVSNVDMFEGRPTSWERSCEKCLRRIFEAAADRKWRAYENSINYSDA